jgi:tRNA A37 threonylcarbamoyladenosine modification protein TsaB
MIIIINTALPEEIELVLVKNQKDFKIWKKSAKMKQSELLLRGIDKLLKDNKVKLTEIKGVGCVIGPGGFTSLRIGVVTANALAYALKVPMASIKLDEYNDGEELVKKISERLKKAKVGGTVLPVYSREPNITMKK